MNFTLISDNNGEYGEIAKSILEEKKSKFISYIFKINNEMDAKEYINKIKKEYNDARHIVYIYSYLDKNNQININFSDDGEPQGTGTKAIYELITKENITNICVIIVRYFGGILLGAGPLSRAYLNSFRNSFKLTQKTEILNYIKKTINIDYNLYDKLINQLKDYISNKHVVINKVEFNQNVLIDLSIEKNILNKVDMIISDIIY